MYTVINDQDIECDIAFGICHQVVRDFAAFEVDGQMYSAGQTESPGPLGSEKLPWFKDFREAVKFLEEQPWTGHLMTYIMEADGSGPSCITNGIHYHKKEGDNRHPFLVEAEAAAEKATSSALAM